MPITIQMPKRTQVSAGRFSISQTEAAIDRIGTSGTSGVRNERCRSGRVRRRMITPRATTTKANSVPMFTSVASSLMLVKPATTAMMTPSRMVGRYGVRNFGWVTEKNRGSRPSRLIAKNTRVCPSSRIMQTVVRPTAAPKLMMPPYTGCPADLNASASGALVDSCE